MVRGRSRSRSVAKARSKAVKKFSRRSSKFRKFRRSGRKALTGKALLNKIQRALVSPTFGMNHLTYCLFNNTGITETGDTHYYSFHLFPPTEIANFVDNIPHVLYQTSGTVLNVLGGYDTGSSNANVPYKALVSGRTRISVNSQSNAHAFITAYLMIPKRELAETSLGAAPLDAMERDFEDAGTEYLTTFSCGTKTAYNAPTPTVAGRPAYLDEVSYGLTPFHSVTLKSQFKIVKLGSVNLDPGKQHTWSFKHKGAQFNRRDYADSGTTVMKRWSRFLVLHVHGELNNSKNVVDPAGLQSLTQIGHGQFRMNCLQSTWWKGQALAGGVQGPAIGSSNVIAGNGLMRTAAYASDEVTELDLTEAAANVAMAQ